MNPFRLLALAGAMAALATPLRAAEVRAFDRATFDAAQRVGRPVLVDVEAWWCPVCASQKHTIKALTAADPRYDRLLILRLDYDKQKAEWQSFGVTKQATLIAFRSGHEVARLRFRTDRGEVAKVLLATLG